MKKVVFLYEHHHPEFWKDGLYAALKLLPFEVEMHNWAFNQNQPHSCDFLLGWGAFNSKPWQIVLNAQNNAKKGLCIAGNAVPPIRADEFDVLFYETNWYKPKIAHHKNIFKAFGANTNIFEPNSDRKVFNIISVGAFANWKRQRKVAGKKGEKLVVGEIQENNLLESYGIITDLLAEGVVISGFVTPERLNELYNISRTAYIPADISGGGERAVLEARLCNLLVEVEDDNPKLKELTTGRIPTEIDYAAQLERGIRSVL